MKNPTTTPSNCPSLTRPERGLQAAEMPVRNALPPSHLGGCRQHRLVRPNGRLSSHQPPGYPPFCGLKAALQRPRSGLLALWFRTALGLLLAATAGAADNASGKQPGHLADLSIEQLLNESVTSVAKKATKLSESPAAITVITQEDIRRTGLTSLPELLRTVPGLDVARINGSQWAISSRGFNLQYSKTLLVLVDGRAVYTPFFGGVLWNAQDVVLADLDRIEVIRGPGATLWGANAVNGVINITTKSAKETQGGLVTTSVGTEERPSATVRYGGQLGTNLFYRAYVKYANGQGLVDSTGKATPDDWNALRGGLRFDWEPASENKFTLQGDYYRSTAGANIVQPLPAAPFAQSLNTVAHNHGGNVLGRWTRTFSDTSQLTVQTYFDHLKQDDGMETFAQQTYDFDVQHRFAVGERNDVVWGAGYRLTDLTLTPSFFAQTTPAHRQLQLFNFFVQDTLALVPERLHLTLGSKFEHNDLTGFEVQPSARLLWKASEHQTVWAAASRAIRTPSLAERDIRVNVATFPSFPTPGVVSIFGNPNAQSEELIAYELGYRVQPLKSLSLEAAVFYNIYDNLLGVVAGAPSPAAPAPPTLIPSTFQNSQSGTTYGTELTARWQVTDHWRLTGSYSWLHMRLRPNPAAEAESPQQQFQLRSDLDLSRNVQLNAAAYYVDGVNSMASTVATPVPSYVRLDVGVTWRPTPSLELGLWGRNLLDNQHPESYSYRTPLRTEVPRTVLGTVTWKF